MSANGLITDPAALMTAALTSPQPVEGLASLLSKTNPITESTRSQVAKDNNSFFHELALAGNGSVDNESLRKYLHNIFPNDSICIHSYDNGSVGFLCLTSDEQVCKQEDLDFISGLKTNDGEPIGVVPKGTVGVFIPMKDFVMVEKCCEDFSNGIFAPVSDFLENGMSPSLPMCERVKMLHWYCHNKMFLAGLLLSPAELTDDDGDSLEAHKEKIEELLKYGEEENASALREIVYAQQTDYAASNPLNYDPLADTAASAAEPAAPAMMPVSIEALSTLTSSLSTSLALSVTNTLLGMLQNLPAAPEAPVAPLNAPAAPLNAPAAPLNAPAAPLNAPAAPLNAPAAPLNAPAAPLNAPPLFQAPFLSYATPAFVSLDSYLTQSQYDDHYRQYTQRYRQLQAESQRRLEMDRQRAMAASNAASRVQPSTYQIPLPRSSPFSSQNVIYATKCLSTFNPQFAVINSVNKIEIFNHDRHSSNEWTICGCEQCIVQVQRAVRTLGFTNVFARGEHPSTPLGPPGNALIQVVLAPKNPFSERQVLCLSDCPECSEVSYMYMRKDRKIGIYSFNYANMDWYGRMKKDLFDSLLAQVRQRGIQNPLYPVEPFDDKGVTFMAISFETKEQLPPTAPPPVATAFPASPAAAARPESAVSSASSSSDSETKSDDKEALAAKKQAIDERNRLARIRLLKIMEWLQIPGGAGSAAECPWEKVYFQLQLLNNQYITNPNFVDDGDHMDYRNFEYDKNEEENEEEEEEDVDDEEDFDDEEEEEGEEEKEEKEEFQLSDDSFEKIETD